MTISEYLDLARFPLTSRSHLQPQQQLMIDAFNHDQLREHLEAGGQLTDEQKAIWAELSEKMQHRAALVAELAQQK